MCSWQLGKWTICQVATAHYHSVHNSERKNWENSPREVNFVATRGKIFSLKFTKYRLAAGLRPDPLGELKRSPIPPSRNERGLLLRGGEGKGEVGGGEGKGTWMEGERDGRGGEGKGEGREEGLCSSNISFKKNPAECRRHHVMTSAKRRS